MRRMMAISPEPLQNVDSLELSFRLGRCTLEAGENPVNKKTLSTKKP
jgi:hypothetical protein